MTRAHAPRQVDLGSSILLSQVNVHHRSDVNRGSGVKVWVSDTEDYASGTQCGTCAGTLPVDEVPCAATGRFVTLQKGGWMHFCEVEVMAAHTETCNAAFPGGMPWSNALLDNIATQSAPRGPTNIAWGVWWGAGALGLFRSPVKTHGPARARQPRRWC